MATSLVLVIKAGHSKPSELVGSGTAGHASVNRLVTYLEACAGGLENASIDAHYSTVAPAASSATATLASVLNNDTIVIGGVTLTAKTSSADGTTQFTRGISDSADATALAACINANTTLSQVVSAKAVGAVVTMTCLQKGVFGNLITLTASATITLSAATMTGGTGGATSAASTYRMGL